MRTVLQFFLIVFITLSGCRSPLNEDRGSDHTVNRFDSAGNKAGPWTEYEDSVLVAAGSYLNGIPDGLWTYYHPNGQLKAEGHYREGVRTGIWVEWYSDGEIMWKGEWHQGKRHIYFKRGEVSIEFPEAELSNHVLSPGQSYRVQIRIQNIPSDYLFVEVSNGSINRAGDSDLFILNTPSDTSMTLAIGYTPDLEFRDFRNLVHEERFRIEQN